MALQFVSNSGRLILYATSGGAVLHSGLCETNTSYRVNVSQTTAQCRESASSEVFESEVTHELSATVNLSTSDTTGLMGLTSSKAYAVFLTQGGTTIFAGSVAITSVSNNSGTRGSVESQDISMRNDGVPTTGAF